MIRWIALTLVLANPVLWLWYTVPDENSSPMRPEGRGETTPEAIRFLGESVPDSGLVPPDLPVAELVTLAVPKRELSWPSFPDKRSTCWLLGPLEEQARARALRERFGGATEIRVVSRAREVAVEHWVYLPMPRAEAAARAIRERLRADNIDHFAATLGDIEDILSVGVFNDRENALRYRNQLRDQGYSVSLHEVPQLRRRFWVLIPGEETADADQMPVIARDPDGVNRQFRTTSCQTVASRLQFQ